MLDKKKIILNEKYLNQRDHFIIDNGLGSKIFFNRKKIIDLSCNSGALLLGHNHKIFKNAISHILKKNFTISSEKNNAALKLAKIIKVYFPKFEKIIFCNSGSEAVIKALRISKSLNSNEKIVSVMGSWHGSVDQTLFFQNDKLKNQNLSSGTHPIHKKNLIFIPYNNIQKSLKILEKNKKKINCIIVEPIQASLPNKISLKYIKFLAEYSKKNKITLIFDEIITGFRCKDGSVQSKIRINPDITLLGKVAGGGFPIGVIGINKRVYRSLKKIKPSVFFGGTFSANFYSCYLGFNVLNYLKSNKKLVLNLCDYCNKIKEEVNKFCSSNNLDVKVYSYDSILRIVFTKKKILNKYQRDFFELKKSRNKINFIKYLLKKNIFYPTNGIILMPAIIKRKEVDYIISHIKIGLKKYFKN